MKIIVQVQVVGVWLSLGACSIQTDPTPQDVWVTASSLTRPNAAYMPNPIITARETDAGMWVWQWQGGVAETLPVEQLLSRVVEARSLRPDPLLLFSFAHHSDSSELTELRSRIASSARCSSVDPCIEGTPEQLP
jgi:hypothetical protein